MRRVLIWVGIWMTGAAGLCPAGTEPSGRTVLHATLELSVTESVLGALERNHEIRVQRLNPPISRTQEEQERSAFDPVLSARAGGRKNKSGGLQGAGVRSEAAFADAGVSTLLPTGTSIGADVSTVLDHSSLATGAASGQVGLSVNQPLLRGFGTDVNLANLRQARLNTFSSEYELRGYAESLVYQVESAYWNLRLSQEQLRIVEDSLQLAQQQLYEIDERIRVGKTAESERAAALAEVALRRESVINARSSLEQSRLSFLRLVNPPGVSLGGTDVVLIDSPTVEPEDLGDAEGHVETALAWRPDLRQARLSLQSQEIEFVQTRNGLLPRMDLFIDLGGTGYSRSFGQSFADAGSDAYNLQAGLQFEFPWRNRSASARHERTLLGREQAERSLENLEQLIQVDVRSARIEANRSREQIEATAATRAAQEEKVRSETEKFRVGKSTSLQVAQAQRDLLSSRIDEVQAQVNYRVALSDFFRQEGTLLQRRGLSAQFVEPESGLLP